VFWFSHIRTIILKAPRIFNSGLFTINMSLRFKVLPIILRINISIIGKYDIKKCYDIISLNVTFWRFIIYETFFFFFTRSALLLATILTSTIVAYITSFEFLKYKWVNIFLPNVIHSTPFTDLKLIILKTIYWMHGVTLWTEIVEC